MERIAELEDLLVYAQETENEDLADTIRAELAEERHSTLATMRSERWAA